MDVVEEMETNEVSLREIRNDIQVIDKYSQDINALIEDLSNNLEAQEEANDEVLDSVLNGIEIAQYVSLLFVILIIISQFKTTFMPITKSIKTLKQGASEIGAGNLAQRVEIKTGDEIEDLATEFNAMARKLEQSYDSLEDQVRDRTAKFKAANEALEDTLKELKTTQGQLIQTEKMSSLGQLVAGVAHEINNPVNFIFGNLTHTSRYIDELLQMMECYEQHYPEPHPTVRELQEDLELDFLKQDLPEALNSMKLGANRIREIVLSLRNFSRLDESDRKEADIHQGIDSTLLILQSRTKAHADRPAITIHKDYSEIPPIYCYPGQLNQVFMNILVNAMDSLEEHYVHQSPEDQKKSELCIHITTRILSPTVVQSVVASPAKLNLANNTESWLEITIADNGSGMPESVSKKLFDPFFTTKKVGQGTGLGLSISYQIIVEKHGGKIYCESTPGQGAKFIIVIPILKEGQTLDAAIANTANE